MDLLWFWIGAPLFGALCYRTAKPNGRDPWLWATLGAVFGLLAFVVLLIMVNTSPRETYGSALTVLRSNPDAGQILDALARQDDAGLTFDELCRATDLTSDEVGEALDVLLDQNAVEGHGQHWALTPRGTALATLVVPDD